MFGDVPPLPLPKHLEKQMFFSLSCVFSHNTMHKAVYVLFIVFMMQWRHLHCTHTLQPQPCVFTGWSSSCQRMEQRRGDEKVIGIETATFWEEMRTFLIVFLSMLKNVQ